MYTITFYSFKGGVGRTMALVNVGLELVRRGRRVLLVDFDLEAPGLTTYEALRQQADHSGVVEYVTEYIRKKESPDVSRFLYSVDLARVTSRRKGRKARNALAGGGSRESTGQLWVMPAGKGDAAYGAALGAINWSSLYEHLNGYLFFEDTKLQWREAVKPDYVLIDSRTGHTDVGGICTRQLADAVVLMFTPNGQNRAGLESICRDIRREETEGLKKKIRLHFVAANVPDLDDDKGILRRQIDAFRERLKFKDLSGVIRQYEDLNLLDQSVVVLDRRKSRLARAYRRLTRMLIADNLADREGALLFLSKCPEDDPYFGDSPFGWPAPIPDPLNRIAENFLDDAEILLHIAECRKRQGDFKKAIAVLSRALTVQPDLAQALFERAVCYVRLGQRDAAVADLLSYIQLPRLESAPLLRALRQLSAIAPERALEAIDLPAFAGVLSSVHGTVAVAKILAEQDEGLPRTIRLLQEVRKGWWARYNSEPPELSGEDCELLQSPFGKGWDCYADELLFQALMRARRWREARELCEDPGPREPYASFALAMIRWGETGELPEDLCRKLLELDDGTEDLKDPLAGCFMLWRLGRIQEALRNLNQVEEINNDRSQSLFSSWTFREVSPDQFREECRQLRRMIQGESIRPAFLGPG